jgi:hypothetical protein
MINNIDIWGVICLTLSCWLTFENRILGRKYFAWGLTNSIGKMIKCWNISEEKRWINFEGVKYPIYRGKVNDLFRDLHSSILQFNVPSWLWKCVSIKFGKCGVEEFVSWIVHRVFFFGTNFIEVFKPWVNGKCWKWCR